MDLKGAENVKHDLQLPPGHVGHVKGEEMEVKSFYAQ